MIARRIGGCKSRRRKNLYTFVARGASGRGNSLVRSLPTMSALGGLRKLAGRNASEPTCSVVKYTSFLEKRMWSPSHFSDGEGCYTASRDRTPHNTLNGVMSRSPSCESVRVGMQWTTGVAGMACKESSSSEAWEPRDASPSRWGDHTIWCVMRTAGVGAVRSSDDARDNITLTEQRGRTSTMRMRRMEARQVLNKGKPKVIEHPVAGTGNPWEVVHA